MAYEKISVEGFCDLFFFGFHFFFFFFFTMKILKVVY